MRWPSVACMLLVSAALIWTQYKIYQDYIKVEQNRWVVYEFWPQEDAWEIPVPKWCDQGDALVSHFTPHFKTIKFWKLNFLNCQILKNVTPWPLHFGTGISTVKMDTKFEILSLYSQVSFMYHKHQGMKTLFIILVVAMVGFLKFCLMLVMESTQEWHGNEFLIFNKMFALFLLYRWVLWKIYSQNTEYKSSKSQKNVKPQMAHF